MRGGFGAGGGANAVGKAVWRGSAVLPRQGVGVAKEINNFFKKYKCKIKIRKYFLKLK